METTAAPHARTTAPPSVRIGISGWRYAPWRGVFYPPGLAQRRELEFASRMLPTIELNGSFYSLQRPEHYARWRDETPDGFVFAVKGSRYVTHLLRLKDAEPALANFFASGLLELQGKLGPILWQLPPSLPFDAERLDAFLALLPHDTPAAAALAARHDARLAGRAKFDVDRPRPLRHALEIRHESFRDPAFVQLLRRRRVALVVADTAGKWPMLDDETADFVYVRLHGDKRLYASGYGDAALDAWAARIRRWSTGRDARDVYVYFDNDVKVHAPYDAAALLARLGLPSGLGAARRPRLKAGSAAALDAPRERWPARGSRPGGAA